MFSTPAAPERQETPEDSAGVPRPTHTAALAIPVCTAHPHSSPRDPRWKNGRRPRTLRARIFESRPPGDGK